MDIPKSTLAIITSNETEIIGRWCKHDFLGIDHIYMTDLPDLYPTTFSMKHKKKSKQP